MLIRWIIYRAWFLKEIVGGEEEWEYTEKPPFGYGKLGLRQVPPLSAIDKTSRGLRDCPRELLQARVSGEHC